MTFDKPRGTRQMPSLSRESPLAADSGGEVADCGFNVRSSNRDLPSLDGTMLPWRFISMSSTSDWIEKVLKLIGE
jgi:hypothetical protein